MSSVSETSLREALDGEAGAWYREAMVGLRPMRFAQGFLASSE